MFIRCQESQTRYKQISKLEATRVDCNGTGTLFLYTNGSDNLDIIQASSKDLDQNVIDKFYPTRLKEDEGLLTALPAYAKYFIGDNVMGSAFKHCTVTRNQSFQIQCICNTQACNGMSKNDLIHFLNSSAMVKIADVTHFITTVWLIFFTIINVS